jgi:hypothetical protein
MYCSLLYLTIPPQPEIEKEQEATVEPSNTSWELYCLEHGITPKGSTSYFVVSSGLYYVHCTVYTVRCIVYLQYSINAWH